jgi:outer membrane murein-binding lipoprotein Lpp
MKVILVHRVFPVLFVGLLLAGCAPKTTSSQPAAISAEEQQRVKQLATETARASAAREAAEKANR